ncbi:alpha-amylase family glycosyl hydrolase [Aureibaculum luteum]|uniref:alpha-amylase family glycosyl hydrolase n=1 Tax=Aureibaculum luteum TaxID=1548456 RepID=UPI000E554839|nr:alpha-amylase family glycosyl hydrolase [Aureibaculum luteum]
MKKYLLPLLISFILFSCSDKKEQKPTEITESETPFVWEAANLYFLLTDRFNNGDPSNDINFERTEEAAKLRGFEGGDIKGITQKIKEGYFTDLGINAIWMTPIVEQIHGGTNEGTGITYGFHGYWTKDWTAIDPNFGTKEDVKELVEVAHKNGIRILLDAVINHTGPVTEKDPVWPAEWVRTAPACTYEDYESTTACTLVENLPDIKTESNEEVDLPPQLVEKWKKEGRYPQEVKELDAFFERTGYPRAPRYYIIKWLTDYITEFGIDGYRVDTVKHTEENVWQEFRTACDVAFAEWKKNNPEKVLDDTNFYMVGEVYNYGISAGKAFDFGDKKVNYFDKSFNALINFELKYDATKTYDSIFVKYDSLLNTNLKGYGVLNYLTSHDDGQPFDAERKKSERTANILYLTPGTSQTYYGDESARDLIIEGTQGDATLRSFMNWDSINASAKTKGILLHWQKMGKFRNLHPAVGAGRHKKISDTPYVFSRVFTKGDFTDTVVIGLDLPKGKKEIKVTSVFKEGMELHDAYSNTSAKVENGKVILNSNYTIVLLEHLKM